MGVGYSRKQSDLLAGLKLPSNESVLNLRRKVIADGSAGQFDRTGHNKGSIPVVGASNRRRRSPSRSGLFAKILDRCSP
jgi:hypothetical protein